MNYSGGACYQWDAIPVLLEKGGVVMILSVRTVCHGKASEVPPWVGWRKCIMSL